MRKRKVIAAGSMILTILLSLSACDSVEDSLRQNLLEKSGITAEENYTLMQQLKNSEQLDEEGVYIVPTSAESTKATDPVGNVEIVFGRNSYLDISYFQDAEFQKSLNQDVCYLNPGDRIYVGSVLNVNPNSNLYKLKEFRIYEYAMDGSLVNQFTQEPGNQLFTIPDGSEGHSFSIMPMGVYPDRQLTMSVYSKDDQNHTQTLECAGDWEINGEPCGEDSVSVPAAESFTLHYDFDENRYFFVDSTPKCFTKDPNLSGFAEFYEEDPSSSNVTDYKVEIHEFLTANLKCTDDAEIKVNEGESASVKKGKNYSLPKIKYGDSIVVETAGDCVVEGDDRHFTMRQEPVGDKTRYIIDVTQECHKNDKEELPENVTVNHQYTVTLDAACPHCECIFKLDGKKVDGTVTVQEDQELTVQCKITEKGYVFADHAQIPWYKSKAKKTVEIPIISDLHNTTVSACNYFSVVRKES